MSGYVCPVHERYVHEGEHCAWCEPLPASEPDTLDPYLQPPHSAWPETLMMEAWKSRNQPFVGPEFVAVLKEVYGGIKVPPIPLPKDVVMALYSGEDL